MTIREAEQALFAEWRRSRPGFVDDGVVDEATYVSSSPRLLFVLKEVNDPGGGEWDLRDYLRQGGRPQTWNNVTRWTQGIRRLPSETPWNDLRSTSKECRKRALRSIVAINLKKSPGGHTTDPVALATTALEDRLFLNRQFALYDPELDTPQTFSTTGLWMPFERY